MSVLETPRLIFRGKVSWDPVTTNNKPAQYNESASETVFRPPAVDTAAFRKAAIDAVTTGNWNPDGTYRSSFFDTVVTGFDVGDGLVTDRARDAILGTPVRFTGMLVDLEPYGSYSSQLFFDGMSFGIDGGCQVKARRETRMTARYINFNRYQPKTPSEGLPIAGVASVTWQTCFSKASLAVGAVRSPVLARFAAILFDDATKDPDVLGLTVRWTAYRTAYFDSLDAFIDPQNRPRVQPALQKKLQDKLRLGGFQPNPARSEVVGVLGLWRKGEPMSEPGDRALLCPPPPPDSPPAPPPQQTILLSTVHVRVSPDAVTLDLSNAVPEVDKKGTKIDLGDIVLTARSSDPGVVAETPVGRIPYSLYGREAYEAGAGIVTLHNPGVGARIANLTLLASCPDSTHQKTGGLASLVEQPLRPIPGQPNPALADPAARILPGSPNLYVDEGSTVPLHVLVLDRGRPAGPGVEVYVAQTDYAGNVKVLLPTPLKTDADGIAALTFPGGRGAVNGYIFMDKTMWDGFSAAAPDFPAAIDTQRTPYAYVRTLPADRTIANLPPSWGNVYESVLRNWNAMAPCMDNWLLLDDEAQVKSFEPILKRVTDPNNFESFRYMPVTRDLTPGARSLLYKFLDGQPVALANAQPEPERHPADLSRSLRQG